MPLVYSVFHEPLFQLQGPVPDLGVDPARDVLGDLRPLELPVGRVLEDGVEEHFVFVWCPLAFFDVRIQDTVPSLVALLPRPRNLSWAQGH